jgi:hypothetical protein
VIHATTNKTPNLSKSPASNLEKQEKREQKKKQRNKQHLPYVLTVLSDYNLTKVTIQFLAGDP